MRSAFRWTLMFAVAIIAALTIGPEHAHALASLNHQSLGTTLLGPAALMGALPFAMVGETADVLTLTSKNRKATELRGKANELRKRIMEDDTLKTDQLSALVSEIKDLDTRANVIAEFTGDEEIRRQGESDPNSLADGQLRRIPSPDHQEESVRGKGTMLEQIAEYTANVKKEFGDVRSFLNIVVANDPRVRHTPAQQKLVQQAGALTRAIVGTSGDVSGGEYLLPLTQVASIFSLANVQQGILQRARAYNVPGRSLRIPYLVQDDTDASTTLDRPMAGNIANVAIIGEGSTKDVRTPKFGQRLLTVYKYAAYTQVGDELLGDDFTGELPQEFVNAVGQQALNAVNEDVTIDGTGSSEPYGALYPGAWNISQTRNTASTILPVDIFAMYAKFTHGPNAVWLASRRTVQSLYNMSLTSASLVTFIQNLNAAPTMMLLGYPVILTDLLPTLGSTSDIALVNPDFYAFALRQALTVELSREYAFIQDLTTYRFVVRAGGITINPGKYAYKYTGTQGVDEHAPFVYLHS